MCGLIQTIEYLGQMFYAYALRTRERHTKQNAKNEQQTFELNVTSTSSTVSVFYSIRL